MVDAVYVTDPVAVSVAELQTLPQSGPDRYCALTASTRLVCAQTDCRAQVPVKSPPQAENVAIQVLEATVPDPLPVPPVPASLVSVKSRQPGNIGPQTAARHRSLRARRYVCQYMADQIPQSSARANSGAPPTRSATLSVPIVASRTVRLECATRFGLRRCNLSLLPSGMRLEFCRSAVCLHVERGLHLFF